MRSALNYVVRHCHPLFCIRNMSTRNARPKLGKNSEAFKKQWQAVPQVLTRKNTVCKKMFDQTGNSHKAACKKTGGGQPDRMGVTATPKSKDGAYWTHWESKEFEGFHYKCFDHHPFYISYN